jgi:hypothetical protein
VNLAASEAGPVAAGAGAVWALVFRARGNELARIDPRTLRVTKTLPAPRIAAAQNVNASFSGDIAVDSDSVWWNSGDAGTVWQVDPRAMTIESTIRLTRPIAAFGDVEPYGIAAGAGNLWVTVTVAP